MTIYQKVCRDACPPYCHTHRSSDGEVCRLGRMSLKPDRKCFWIGCPTRRDNQADNRFSRIWKWIDDFGLKWNGFARADGGMVGHQPREETIRTRIGRLRQQIVMQLFQVTSIGQQLVEIIGCDPARLPMPGDDPI